MNGKMLEPSARKSSVVMMSVEKAVVTSAERQRDPLGLKHGLPCDKKCYDYQDARNASFTYYNGVIIVFNFDEFRKKKLRTLKLPVYFVNPGTGNFTILHSLPSWPNDVSRGILVPLSRKEMITALKDYPGNKS